MKPLYYESHITIEPVFDDRLQALRVLCEAYQFRVADLLMQKRRADSPKRSANDTFCTGRSQDAEELSLRMLQLVHALTKGGYQVWRYKLEAALMDIRLKEPNQPLI